MQLPFSRLLKTMFVLIVIGHLDGCIFWVIDRYLEGNRRWVVVNKLMDKDVSFATQYLTSYLTAVKSLVLKLREVENNIESIYVIIEYIAGIVNKQTSKNSSI